MYNIMLEVLASIFTIDNGVFKILLLRRKREPYKGYWILPGGLVSKDKTVDDSIAEYITNQVGLSNLKYEQNMVFSDIERVPNKRVVGISMISIVDEFKVKLHQEETNYEISWFAIDKLPKIGYDHSKIIESSVLQLKNKLNQSHTLRQMFPSDFTLPEIQQIYEQVLGYDLDRRNFRKKFLKLNLIEETGDTAPSVTGRPAKLYRFRQEIDNVLLF